MSLIQCAAVRRGSTAEMGLSATLTIAKFLEDRFVCWVCMVARMAFQTLACMIRRTFVVEQLCDSWLGKRCVHF